VFLSRKKNYDWLNLLLIAASIFLGTGAITISSKLMFTSPEHSSPRCVRMKYDTFLHY
jgi:hypothetical protein